MRCKQFRAIVHHFSAEVYGEYEAEIERHRQACQSCDFWLSLDYIKALYRHQSANPLEARDRGKLLLIELADMWRN